MHNYQWTNEHAEKLDRMDCGEMLFGCFEFNSVWRVTRVPGGWIFSSKKEGSVFVPYSKEFVTKF